MFRSAQFVAPRPFAAVLAILFAGCDASEVSQDENPISPAQDAATAPDAGKAETGSPSALDAGVPDASAPVQSASDAGASNTARDAGPRLDASAGDANTQPAPSDPGAADGGTPDGGTGDMRGVASALDRLFVDVPCTPNTPTPLANGATCQHPSGTQRIEKVLTMGGTGGTVYEVKLRVRGIWEPTKIQGGERPDKQHPFTIGGMVPPGSASSDAINYQQYSIQVAEPKQTFWLNDHQYLAHDIHREDYTVTLPIAGGSKVTVIMNDGNDHQIANWTKALFNDLPPYDKTPSLGQSLRLDVVSVSVRP